MSSAVGGPNVRKARVMIEPKRGHVDSRWALFCDSFRTFWTPGGGRPRETLSSPVLSATLVFTKNSRVLDATSAKLD